ncbi:MAG TPA: HD domain-containing phosphohydrolase [Dongiaceae bacterium]|nr:HD domain-containing phosphohydrolase [Dongiaceae bacterium]
MPLTLGRWLEFLAIDADVLEALRDFAGIVEPHMDGILDHFYERILAQEAGAKLFKNPEMLAHVREAQRRHWVEHVFAGRFDHDYLRATLAMGRSHFRLGVDPMLFSTAYCLVLNEVGGVILAEFGNQPALQRRYLTAVNRAVFLDLGLATSVYYDAYLADIEGMSRELNFSLARAGEYRDNETGLHLIRMSRMCRALALAAGQDARWADMLQVASPLHDLGKIGVPDSVLLKAGRLDPAEVAVMRKHPQIGADIIPDHPAAVIRMARRIALSHHERWDGSGYPTGLCGEEIPLEGRIATICDVYDALLAERPYKKAWDRQDAVAFMRENRGAMFDPMLIDIFLAILPTIDAIQTSYAEETARADDRQRPDGLVTTAAPGCDC